MDKISWSAISLNPSCIEILEHNKDKIDWINISRNPEIFVLDCAELKKHARPFVEELMMKCYHPLRLERYLCKYKYDIGNDTYEIN
jgi:hypothetical protein